MDNKKLPSHDLKVVAKILNHTLTSMGYESLDPPLTEEEGFIIEAALQRGFEHIDDDATLYVCSTKELVALVRGVKCICYKEPSL